MATDDSGEAVIRRYLEAAEARDFGVIGEFASDDLLMEWPQSGERFRGRDNVVAAIRAQTTKPVSAGDPRIVGGGDVWTVMMPLRYGDEIYHYVGVYELDGDKIRRSNDYFGSPFPAQDFRARWVDKG
jgi:hypothetical protein